MNYSLIVPFYTNKAYLCAFFAFFISLQCRCIFFCPPYAARITRALCFHATSSKVHFYSPLSQDFRISPDSDYHAASDNVHFYSPLSQDFRIFPDSDNSSSVQALVFAQLALMSADVSALFDRLQPQ